MRILTSIGLTAALVVALATAANATPTLVGTTTNPTGINGLIVDGTIYNVTFSTTTLNSFTFFTTLSTDATNALSAALQALSVSGFAGAPATEIIAIDVDSTLTAGNWSGPVCSVPCSASNWGIGAFPSGFVFGSNAFPGPNNLYVLAGDFAAVGTVGVPEPLTLSLFGAGLAGAIALRRKAKNKA